jgi:hypothetical protein
VADYYRHQEKFEMIQGIGTVDEIFKALSTLIEAEIAHQQSVSAQ